MIPAEAVEAAARVLHGSGEQSWLAWDDITPFGREAYRSQARTILEAAAPHMLIEAFNQGQKSGMRHADRLVAAAKIGHPEPPGPISPNPYEVTK